MTKPTGRPRGRPKTKEYVTLMARVDVALATQVKRYASLHRQPISLVIRDALSLLMEEYPAEADRTGSHRLAAHEFLSDRYESPLDTLIGETDSVGLEALLSDTNVVGMEEIMSYANRDTTLLSDAKKDEAMMSDRNTGYADIMSDGIPVFQEEEPGAAQDTAAQPPDKAAYKTTLAARIQAMRAEGMSYGAIAAHLNAAWVPTLAGKGQWGKGTVERLAKRPVEA